MKEDIKRLLRESISVYEVKKDEFDDKDEKSSAEKEMDKEERDEKEGHKEKEISDGDKATLKKLYMNNIQKHREGGILAKCVFGNSEDRSKLRQFMRGTKEDEANVGRPTIELYNKIIDCVVQNKNDYQGAV
jgi:hypothetical protein